MSPDSKDTILVVTSTAPRWPGDHEPRFVLDLCRALSREFRSVIISPHCKGSAVHEHIEGVEFKRYRYFPSWGEVLAYDGGMLPKLRASPQLWLLVPFFLAWQVFAILNILRREPVRVVHAHWLIPGAFCSWIALRLLGRSIPLVCTVHGADLFGLQWAPLRLLQRFLANRCERVCAVSEVVAKALIERGVDPKRIEVLPMGVALPPSSWPRPGIGSTAPQIVFVGRMVEKKGIPVLIRAFQRLVRDHSSAELILAGDGPDLPANKDMVTALGMNRQVRFLGAIGQSAVSELFASATVAVVPSQVATDGDSEGLGLVALEAMATGCPVIASDVPAFQTFIVHGRTGILFPAGDFEALAEALRQFLQMPDGGREIASRARDFVYQNFGWDHVAEKYGNMLMDVLRQKTSRHGT